MSAGRLCCFAELRRARCHSRCAPTRILRRPACCRAPRQPHARRSRPRSATRPCTVRFTAKSKISPASRSRGNLTSQECVLPSPLSCGEAESWSPRALFTRVPWTSDWMAQARRIPTPMCVGLAMHEGPLPAAPPARYSHAANLPAPHAPGFVSDPDHLPRSP